MDRKEEARKALLQNAALVALLGGKRVYKRPAPDGKEFPRVTIFEVVDNDADYADDEPMSRDVVLQVDEWNKVDTQTIFKEIDKTMKENGWRRTAKQEFYEQDTQVHHKALRYRQKFDESEI
jgi:hypothetical protein